MDFVFVKCFGLGLGFKKLLVLGLGLNACGLNFIPD